MQSMITEESYFGIKYRECREYRFCGFSLHYDAIRWDSTALLYIQMLSTRLRKRSGASVIMINEIPFSAFMGALVWCLKSFA